MFTGAPTPYTPELLCTVRVHWNILSLAISWLRQALTG